MFIQNRIAKVGTRRGQLLAGDDRDGETDRTGEHQEDLRLKHPHAGAHDDQDAGEPEHDAAGAADRHALAQHRHRQQRHPERHGELEREHGRERQQGQAQRPGILRRIVHAVAEHVQPHATQRQRRAQLRPQGGERDQHHHAGAVADHEDLEDVQPSGEPADRYRHGAERQEGPGHPEDHAAEIGLCHDGVFLGPVVGECRRRADHSASGWFSGRALSKAASFRHASFAARINGNASSGTLNRCALATCGTRQTSASVTCAPQQ